MAFFKPEEREKFRSASTKAVSYGTVIALFIAPIVAVVGIGKAIGNLFSSK